MSTELLRFQHLFTKIKRKCEIAGIPTEINEKEGLFTINLPTTSDETKTRKLG